MFARLFELSENVPDLIAAWSDLIACQSNSSVGADFRLIVNASRPVHGGRQLKVGDVFVFATRQFNANRVALASQNGRVVLDVDIDFRASRQYIGRADDIQVGQGIAAGRRKLVTRRVPIFV